MTVMGNRGPGTGEPVGWPRKTCAPPHDCVEDARCPAGAGQGSSGRCSATGRVMRKVVPLPGCALHGDARRPAPVMMPWQMDSPSPVPTPTGLVVKKGSKMRPSISGGMPQPVSRTSTTTAGSPCRARHQRGSRRSPPGHGLRRVDQQVEEHLAQPRLVAQHQGHLAESRTSRARLRILVRPSHRRVQHRVQVHRLQVAVVRARERLQALDDVPHALGALARLGERLLQLARAPPGAAAGRAQLAPATKRRLERRRPAGC